MDPAQLDLTSANASAPIHGPQALLGFGLPDDNEDARIYGPVLTTALVALIVVSLRCWVRFRVIRTWSWDDYFIIMAMVTDSLTLELNDCR